LLAAQASRRNAQTRLPSPFAAGRNERLQLNENDELIVLTTQQ